METKEKSKTGRKTKLSKEIGNLFCRQILRGSTILAACQRVGIDEGTFYNWKKKADEAKTDRDPFFQFFKQLGKAEAMNRDRLLRRIDNHGKKDWRALAWLLEKRHPKEFGAYHDSAEGNPVGIGTPTVVIKLHGTPAGQFRPYVPPEEAEEKDGGQWSVRFGQEQQAKLEESAKN